MKKTLPSIADGERSQHHILNSEGQPPFVSEGFPALLPTMRPANTMMENKVDSTIALEHVQPRSRSNLETEASVQGENELLQQTEVKCLDSVHYSGMETVTESAVQDEHRQPSPVFPYQQEFLAKMPSDKRRRELTWKTMQTVMSYFRENEDIDVYEIGVAKKKLHEMEDMNNTLKDVLKNAVPHEEMEHVQKELQKKEETIRELVHLGRKQEVRLQALKEIVQVMERDATQTGTTIESSRPPKGLVEKEYKLQVECDIIQRRLGNNANVELTTADTLQTESAVGERHEPEAPEHLIPNLYRISVDEKMQEIASDCPATLIAKWRKAEDILVNEIKETTDELNKAQNEIRELTNLLSKCARPEEKARLQNQLQIKTAQVECLQQHKQILEKRCCKLQTKIEILENRTPTAEDKSQQLRELTEEEVQLQVDYNIIQVRLQNIGRDYNIVFGNRRETMSERRANEPQATRSTSKPADPDEADENRKLQIELQREKAQVRQLKDYLRILEDRLKNLQEQREMNSSSAADSSELSQPQKHLLETEVHLQEQSNAIWDRLRNYAGAQFVTVATWTDDSLVQESHAHIQPELRTIQRAIDRWTKTMDYFGPQNLDRNQKEMWLLEYKNAALEYMLLLQEHFRSFLDLQIGSRELEHIFKTDYILGHMADELMYLNDRTNRYFGVQVNYIEESLSSTADKLPLCREYLEVLDNEQQMLAERLSDTENRFHRSTEYFMFVEERTSSKQQELEHVKEKIREIIAAN